MEYIYKIIEENVDGCGGNAELYVEATQILTLKKIQALQNILKEVKASYEDYSTEDMVEEACNLFNERFTTQIKTVGGPFITELTF